jgi:hypothetical protein
MWVSVVGPGWAHCWVLRKRAVFGATACGWWPCPPQTEEPVGFSDAVDVSRRYEGLGVRWFGVWLVFLLGWSPVIPVRLLLGVGCRGAGWAGFCLLFVNCIVDASIFVAKFFRAHGGCLGIRSR